jgi:hypothetical protein
MRVSSRSRDMLANARTRMHADAQDEAIEARSAAKTFHRLIRTKAAAGPILTNERGLTKAQLDAVRTQLQPRPNGARLGERGAVHCPSLAGQGICWLSNSPSEHCCDQRPECVRHRRAARTELKLRPDSIWLRRRLFVPRSVYTPAWKAEALHLPLLSWSVGQV